MNDPEASKPKCIEGGQQIGTKSTSVIGDIVEMNSKTPSVVSSSAPNNRSSPFVSNAGCDNKAFTNDR